MIKQSIEIVNEKEAYHIKFELPYRLNLKDKLYIWDFVSDFKDIPEWIEEGGIAEITEVNIFDEWIDYTAIYKYE